MADTPYTPPPTDEALLTECDVWTFRGTGPGGQGVNTTDSAVRLRHRPTGITLVCRAERSQLRNKLECLKRLRKRLEALAAPPPAPRKRTRPSRAAVERRLTGKSQVAAKKRARRRPPAED